MRCLVVDGSAVTRRIVRNALAGLGADEVLEHADADGALEAEGPFDLLVAARTLGGVDGIELARRMREKPGADALPVLLVAAHVTRRDVDLARRAGVAGFVVRPLAAETLRARIEALLPGHAASDRFGAREDLPAGVAGDARDEAPPEARAA